MKRLVVMYKFPEGLYPESISYVHPYSAFQFFGHPDETKAFLNYLVFRIKQEYEKKKYESNYRFVALIENDKMPTIDIEYNFLILVLGEWIEHYSFSKNMIHEYTREHSFNVKDELDNSTKARKQRTFKIDFSVQEKVLFDYGMDGWLIANPFHKKCRFDLFHNFSNNMVHSKMVWINLKISRDFHTANLYYLLKDLERNGEYVVFHGIQFLRETLKKNVGLTSLNFLKKVGGNFEKVTSQNIHVSNKINKLKEDGIEVKYYKPFDIEKIETERDLGDKKWHFFKSEDKVAESEENEV